MTPQNATTTPPKTSQRTFKRQ